MRTVTIFSFLFFESQTHTFLRKQHITTPWASVTEHKLVLTVPQRVLLVSP